jgi:hypothetical protein
LSSIPEFRGYAKPYRNYSYILLYGSQNTLNPERPLLHLQEFQHQYGNLMAYSRRLLLTLSPSSFYRKIFRVANLEGGGRKGAEERREGMRD